MAKILKHEIVFAEQINQRCIQYELALLEHLVPVHLALHKCFKGAHVVEFASVLTLLHSEWPKLKSFGHSECNRVKKAPVTSKQFLLVP